MCYTGRMKASTQEIFEELFARYSTLEACRADVHAAFDALAAAYRAGGLSGQRISVTWYGLRI